jgi:hypothetical protein
MAAFIEGRMCLNCEMSPVPRDRDIKVSICCCNGCYLNIQQQQSFMCRVLYLRPLDKNGPEKPLLQEAKECNTFEIFNSMVKMWRLRDNPGLTWPERARLCILQGITGIVLRFPDYYDPDNIPKEEITDHKWDMKFIKFGISLFAEHANPRGLEELLLNIPILFHQMIKDTYTEFRTKK